MNPKQFIVKENQAFRLRVITSECLSPKNLNNIKFIQECIDKDGEVDFSSTYQFFMTDEEVRNLCEGLLK